VSSGLDFDKVVEGCGFPLSAASFSNKSPHWTVRANLGIAATFRSAEVSMTSFKSSSATCLKKSIYLLNNYKITITIRCLTIKKFIESK